MPDKPKKPKLLLIDGNNLLYRAFFALPLSMRTKSGQATNAVYGFITMILKLMDEQQPDRAAVAFDSQEPTFRHEVFKEYKANRDETPDDLVTQFEPARMALDALGIKKLEEPGQEADDIIAALANEGKAAGYEVIIITSDKDMLQLVGDGISVVSSKKSIADMVVYDREKVFERYGVYPELIPDLLALKGDSSDNIPGVPGIGEKTASKLISEFGAVESIYERISEVKPDRIRGLLIDHEDKARLSKTLTILDGKDVSERDPEMLLVDSADPVKTSQLFTELEFFTLLKRFSSGGVSIAGSTGTPSNASSSPRTETEQDSLFAAENPDDQDNGARTALGNTPDRPLLSRTHATGEGAKLLSLVQFSEIPLDERELLVIYAPGPQEELSNGETNQATDELLFKCRQGSVAWHRNKPSDPKDSTTCCGAEDLSALIEISWSFVRRAGFNIKALYKDPVLSNIMYTSDNEAKPAFFTDDPMLAAYCVDPTYSPEDLEKLLLRYLHAHLDNPADTENDAGELSTANDSSVLIPLMTTFDEQLSLHNALTVYKDIEVPLAEVLAKIEMRGIAVDSAILRKNLIEVTKKLQALETEIYEHADGEFNINSPQQLGAVLFEKLNLPVQRKTKTGYSTDAQTLEKLKEMHRIVPCILEYRESFKLRSTYFEVLPDVADRSNGRIHTTFNQVQTSTGRLSSSDPNLQNIPVRSELGRKIREAFIPGPEYDVLMSADYSQIELRLLAHFSRDEKLIEAFTGGEDIHTSTAAEIMHKDLSEVTDSDRRVAKAVNFGIVYGISSFGLSEQLQISKDEAKKYIDLYFSRYPGVVEFIETTISQVKDLGYSETLYGRRRPITQLRSRVAAEHNLGRRLAVNSVLQGSAADIIKLAMINVEDHFKYREKEIRLILSVHDELIFEAKRDNAELHLTNVANMMGSVCQLRVPLSVNTSLAANWAALK